MNTSRIFNEVGELYEASIINEGKSRFPGIGDGSFEPQTNKKVVPAVAKGTKAYVQQDSGPDHEGAKTLIKPNDAKNRKNPTAEEESSVYNPERFSGQSPKKSISTKKAKKKEKMQKESINNFMTKSIFDKLYETVMNEDAMPGDDNIEAHDAEALDLPIGDEEGEVTFTLDRETAKKLHEALMNAIGEEPAESEHEGEEPEGEDLEDEDSETFGEATDIQEIKISGAAYVKDGKKHPWEVDGKNDVVGDETEKLEDGEEGDGKIKKQEDSAGTSHGHALVNAKRGKPTPVTPNSNQVSKQNPGSRTHRNVGQVLFKK